MPVLTTNQERALTALGWLFDGRRREGRSTVLAIALIRHALMHPGTRVTVHDHTHPNTDEHDLRLAMVVGSLLAVDPALRGLYRRELLTAMRPPAVCFLHGLPGAATWLPPDWRRTDALDELTAMATAVFPSWVAPPADRNVVPAALVTRQEKPTPPRARQSLWDLLEED